MAKAFEVKLFGRWDFTTRALIIAPRSLKNAAEKSMLAEAERLRKLIVQGIINQAPGGKPFVPLKPETLARRRREGFMGTKALIRTGSMVRAIQVIKKGPFQVTVGIPSGKTGRGNVLLADLARIHEEGAPAANIPARPFMRPVFEAERKNIAKNVMKGVGKNLGGFFGRIFG